MRGLKKTAKQAEQKSIQLLEKIDKESRDQTNTMLLDTISKEVGNMKNE
jgi:hypothetical protein